MFWQVLVISLVFGVFGEIRTNFSFWSGNSKDRFFLTDEIQYPAYEGFELRKGANLKSLFFSSVQVVNENFRTELVSEVGANFPSERPDNFYLHRFRGTTRFHFFEFSAGKDSLILGPALHNPTIVSKFVPPQKFFAVSLGKSRIPYVGQWFLSFGNIFATDTPGRFKNPNFTFMTVEWTPPFLEFLSLGAERLLAWGGEGGFKPSNLRDVWDLFTARLENAVGVCYEIQDKEERQKCIEYWRSRDTNQMVGIYITADIRKLFDLFRFEGFGVEKGFFYFEYSADDIRACWQVEDRDMPCFPLPVEFLAIVKAIGGYLTFENEISFLFEFSLSRRAVYTHGNYPLYISDRPLGMHTGRYSWDIWSKFIFKLGNFFFSVGPHITRRWLSEGLTPESLVELQLATAYDISEYQTVSFSLVPMIFENPNTGTLSYGNFKKGRFFDIIVSVFYSRRFF